MSGNTEHPASADSPGNVAQARVCILRVDTQHRTRVYDPRRVLAGTLTSALTWGVFGLLTGGVASGGVWAIIGAVCGVLFAYYTEHLLTKDELQRIGRRLPGAAIGWDLLARVLAGAVMPVESSSAPPGGGPVPARRGSALSMLPLRNPGEKAARHELARHRSQPGNDGQPVQTELIFEALGTGRLKVSDPAQGAWAFAKSDLVSSEADLTQDAIDDWSEPGSERLIVRFNAADDGVLLEV